MPRAHALVLLLLALLVRAPAAASADLLRAPASGLPAIGVQLPAGWKGRIDNDLTVSVYCPGGCALLAGINEVNPELSLFDYASSTLSATGAGPIYRTEVGIIDGRSGETFTANIKASNGGIVVLSLTVVRISSGRVAVTLQQCIEGASTAQQGEVWMLAQRIRLFLENR